MSIIGKTLGNFPCTALLGKGGMGEVYRAKDTKLGRDVAIKVLPEEFAQDTDRITRFQREAKLLASLNHQNIAAIHGLEEADGTHFLVLELVEYFILRTIVTKLDYCFYWPNQQPVHFRFSLSLDFGQSILFFVYIKKIILVLPVSRLYFHLNFLRQDLDSQISIEAHFSVNFRKTIAIQQRKIKSEKKNEQNNF